jgi:hypothetical protein
MLWCVGSVLAALKEIPSESDIADVIGLTQPAAQPTTLKKQKTAY